MEGQFECKVTVVDMPKVLSKDALQRQRNADLVEWEFEFAILLA